MKLSITKFGPIRDAQLEFGDLTFIIGPQASGKSLSLELLKLILDKEHIINTLKKYNYILGKKDSANLLDLYFGEGLSALFSKDTRIALDEVRFSTRILKETLAHLRASQIQNESVFYVPAQRILSISDGRPKNFTEFDMDTPYVLRRFSENLRILLQGGLGNPNTIFPMRNRLKGGVRQSINDNIFHNAKVVIDQDSKQRKMKLDVDGMKVPFMAWSAGQKEFMPLLLAVYCISGPPSGVVKKDDYSWIIIEEPEMGLHPRAILSVLLEILELIQRDLKVIISTHSTTLMEFVWAFNHLKNLPCEEFRKAMCDLFDIGIDASAANLFDGLTDKSLKTYYSGQKSDQGVSFVDISSLDAFANDSIVSEWGGLISFSSKTSEIVSRYAKEI